jgi:hypothetical protein
MTLTEEILQNISEYKMAPFDAEADVIKAHMEACMRDIHIASECEAAGIIMESDDWDGNIVPKRNGENIIKYIFLFIPRIIINICKKIHAWWVGLKQKYLEKAEAKYDEALFKDVSGEMLRFCAEINAHLAGGNVTYTGSGFVYMSRIKDINGVAAYYEEFEKRFEDYKKTVVSISEITDEEQIKKMLTSAKESAVPISEDLVSSNYEYPIPINGVKDNLVALDDVIKAATKNIENAMMDIEAQYKKASENCSRLDDAIGMATLERYMKNVDQVEKNFHRFSVITTKDMEEIVSAAYIISERVPVWREELLNKRPTPTKRKDLEKKLDKWGVK